MCLLSLLKSILRRILSKFKRDTKELKVTTKVELKTLIDTTQFNDKQMKVINKTAELGLNYKILAKAKYDYNQMLILLYGLILKIDIGKISSYTMGYQEMEYNLYLLVIDKYLGENYLKKLLAGKNASVSDKLVKEIINTELETVVGSLFEIASTTEESLCLETSEESGDEKRLYDYLVKLSKTIGLAYEQIYLDSKVTMLRIYSKLEENFINTSHEIKIDYRMINKQMSFVPLIDEVLDDTDIYSRIDPIFAYSKSGQFLTKYYKVYCKREVYLYSQGYNIIKLK